jgi:hypothetical protein
MQSVIAQVNRLIEAAAVLDGFENRYLQDGEWLRRGQTSLSNLVNNLDENLAFLAGRDVDRAGQEVDRAHSPEGASASIRSRASDSTRSLDDAISLSNQLERPEVRLMAQLQIAQGVLTRNGTLNQNGTLNCIGRVSNNRGFINSIP